MPGFDGTGPSGQGPMTGGGRGFCAMPYRAYGPYEYGVRALNHVRFRTAMDPTWYMGFRRW